MGSYFGKITPRGSGSFLNRIVGLTRPKILKTSSKVCSSSPGYKGFSDTHEIAWTWAGRLRYSRKYSMPGQAVQAAQVQVDKQEQILELSIKHNYTTNRGIR